MPFPREQQQENYQQPAPQKLPGFPSTALPLPHRQQKPLWGCVVNCTGRLIKIKALERQASPAPHTFWSLHYTATWMFFFFFQHVEDAWWVSGSKEKEMEDRGRTKDYFFCQCCLIWNAHKTVGSLHSAAGGIVMKNRSTEPIVWLNLSFAFPQKITKYLKI